MNKILEKFNIFHTVSTYSVCTFTEPVFPVLLISYPVLVQANLFPCHSSQYYPFITVFQVVTYQAVYVACHNAFDYPPKIEVDCDCESKSVGSHRQHKRYVVRARGLTV